MSSDFMLLIKIHWSINSVKIILCFKFMKIIVRDLVHCFGIIFYYLKSITEPVFILTVNPNTIFGSGILLISVTVTESDI